MRNRGIYFANSFLRGWFIQEGGHVTHFTRVRFSCSNKSISDHSSHRDKDFSICMKRPLKKKESICAIRKQMKGS